ncbi:MAG: putative Ig domain-containing protein [Pseudomonadota bacterium]
MPASTAACASSPRPIPSLARDDRARTPEAAPLRYHLLWPAAVALFLAACGGEGSGGGTGTAPPQPGDSNTAPIISGSPPAQAEAERMYVFVPDASDPDNDALTFKVDNAPGWAIFSEQDGSLSGQPTQEDVGTYTDIVISVSDGTAESAISPFDIVVVAGDDPEPPAPINQAPRISGTPSTNATVGQPYSFTPMASDEDGDTLTFSVAGAPPWATFSSSTGTLSGTPQTADVGSYPNMVITVSDGALLDSLPPTTIAVSTPEAPPPPPPVNTPPTIAGVPPASTVAGSPYVFQPSASDADGDSLTFSALNLPAWLSFSPATGAISGVPQDADAGTYTGLLISVSDGQDSATIGAFSIRVDPAPNSAPTISGTPPSAVVVGELYTFTPSAEDEDGDTLTFSIENAPDWASFSTLTGQLSGTPNTADVGTYAGIAITVSDGQDSAAISAFSIRVDDEPNSAPTIAGTPPVAVVVGELYSFTPNADDEDGDTLTFSIDNAPDWATFSTVTGELSGTPQEGDEGSYAAIVIAVSDGSAEAALDAFAISVEAVPNAVPTIEGEADPQVVAGSSYLFAPDADDPDGDTLSFTVDNVPSWASFSTTTGELSGTPEAADVGLYENILITVTDGVDSASLMAFSIEVLADGGNSVTLSWTPPTENTDDSALTNLAGYRIHYGTATGSYTEEVALDNPGLSSYVVEGLMEGEYFFAITAVNDVGIESAYSDEVSATLPP